jgi:hypothetical protein
MSVQVLTGEARALVFNKRGNLTTLAVMGLEAQTGMRNQGRKEGAATVWSHGSAHEGKEAASPLIAIGLPVGLPIGTCECGVHNSLFGSGQWARVK